MKIIDLTYPIHKGMFKYPSDSEVEIKKIEAKAEQEECFGWSEGDNNPLISAMSTKYKSGHLELNIQNHHGTHIDAPCHKIPQDKTIDLYPICKFLNKALVIDLTTTDLLKRKKREIKSEDVREYLSPDRFQKLQGIGALVFYTGFCNEMLEKEGKLQGEAKVNFEKTFPYFNEQTIRSIMNFYKGLNIIGIDSFSFDPKGSNSEIHRKMFFQKILPLETLVNLQHLSQGTNSKEFNLHCVPINYQEGDAAQCRAYAILE